jgi:4-amino-4-deoxy-L-arabinose transferase-like glycosyltransferase
VSRVLVPLFALLALAQTLAYYAYLRGDPGNYNGAGQQGDQVAYIDLAQQVLHGTWQGAVHYMPGLPAVIALAQTLFGDPRLGIAVLQGLVYAALVLAAARLASRVFGPSAAPWAAALVGLNPALGYYASQALTEFLTGTVLFGLVAAVWRLAPRAAADSEPDAEARPGDASRLGPRAVAVPAPDTEARLAAANQLPTRAARSAGLGWALLAGALIGLATYLRAEYLALAGVFALVVVWLGRSRWRTAVVQAGVLVIGAGLVIAPWVARYAVVTGQPALYNESPFSNLVLMGTWFRVFDEQTFTQLQAIETAPGPREQAIEQARSVGPRPELSTRYMEQARGPYDRPVPETLGLAAENIRLNTRQYLVNHLVLAPVLIWAGRTPVRQADAAHLPASARYLIWAAEAAVVVLALWHGVAGVSRGGETTAISLAFLAVVAFLTLVHILIGVDERFTTPALPLVGLFAGARLSQVLAARRGLSPQIPVLASARRAR